MTFEATIRHLSPKDQLIETLLWRGFAVEPYLDGLLLHKQSHDQDAATLAACGLEIQRIERVDESDRLFIAPQPTPESLLKRLFELPPVNGLTWAPEIDDTFETFKAIEFGPRLDTEHLEPGTALLVKALNQVGVYTVMSCDGHGDKAPQIWLRTRWDYLWCRYVLQQVEPFACRQKPWHNLPDEIREDVEQSGVSLWTFSEDLRAGWMRYSFTWGRPGFEKGLEISNPVFSLIQSFARELLRPRTALFLRREKATMTECGFSFLEGRRPPVPGFEAALDCCILNLINYGKKEKVLERLIQMRMQMDLFGYID